MKDLRRQHLKSLQKCLMRVPCPSMKRFLILKKQNISSVLNVSYFSSKSHKSETLSTPEKERRTSSMNMSLALSPILGSREEQEQDTGQLICTECSDLWGPPTAACSTASSREEQEKWKTLCSKCWTNFTTCPDYYRFIVY